MNYKSIVIFSTLFICLQPGQSRVKRLQESLKEELPFIQRTKRQLAADLARASTSKSTSQSDSRPIITRRMAADMAAAGTGNTTPVSRPVPTRKTLKTRATRNKQSPIRRQTSVSKKYINQLI